MTRGLALLIVLALMGLSIWMSIKYENVTEKTMEQSTEIQELKNKLKQLQQDYTEGNQIIQRQKQKILVMDDKIHSLSKENVVLNQLVDFERKKVNNLKVKHNNILKEHALAVNDVREMLDSIIYRSNAELLEEDSTTHNRKSAEGN